MRAPIRGTRPALDERCPLESRRQAGRRRLGEPERLGEVAGGCSVLAEFRQFSIRLENQLQILREVIEAEHFNRWQPTIGAELEVYLADQKFMPAAVNEQLLERAAHPQLTEELNRYNLEFNLSPVPAEGAPGGSITLAWRFSQKKSLSSSRPIWPCSAGR